MTNVIQYILSIGGSADSKVASIKKGMDNLADSVSKTQSLFQKMSNVSFGINNIVQVVRSAKSAMGEFATATSDKQEAVTKLAQVMHNTMSATDEQVQSVQRLAEAQQRLGIVSDEVQLAGAQELGTYLQQTSSLEQLIPVMNDMVAQQYGFNATQESAVNIATMMGKVMDGQVGALSRYGYSFTEAQEQILKFGTEEQRAATLAEVISDSVGGVNKALAATPQGQIKHMADAYGELQERVGVMLNRVVVMLQPVINDVLRILGNLLSWLEGKVNFIVGLVNVLYDMRFMILSVGGAVMGIIGAIKVWTVVQAVLNAVLAANPIGLIVIGVAALIGFIATVINKWNEWGAALSVFLGPLGLVISAIQSIRTHWDSIVQAFKSDGILAGLKRIGQTLLDVILYPLQQLLQVISEIPGIGKFAAQGASKIEELRTSMNLTSSETASATEASTGINDKLVAATQIKSQGLGVSGENKAADTTAVATGGTRNTEIHINIGDMIKQVVFNGTTAENKQEIEQHFAECLYRVLGMAQVSV